jgi:hypothetical protein
MTNLVTGGIIATVSVLAIGVLISIQPFFQAPKSDHVLLAFSIVSDENMPNWCENLADTLNRGRIEGVVFFSGEVAKKYPDCVASFDKHVDIGSSTYSYTTLTETKDYSVQLEEVQSGKQAVDDAGNLASRVFKAPNGATDENIYSLLTRSDIVADFSYQDRYHKIYEDEFIWFPIRVLDIATESDAQIEQLTLEDGNPVQINMNNSIPLNEVRSVIDQLRDKRADFINPSELTGIPLTLWREE